MKVLIACEFSGIVRDAFRSKGHEAISCDFLPSEKEGAHVKGDVLEILAWGWDLMIAHPPCQYLSNSGVRWLKTQPGRWEKMTESALFFKKLLDADIEKIAVENSIMHRYAVEIIGRKQDQIIQPYMFGHPEKKATCFWLKNLPKLKETNNVKEAMDKLPMHISRRVHYASPGKDRWKERSRTLIGVASAMADQWGARGDEEVRG